MAARRARAVGWSNKSRNDLCGWICTRAPNSSRCAFANGQRTPHLSQRIPETRPNSPWSMPEVKVERHEEVGKLCAPVIVPSRSHLSARRPPPAWVARVAIRVVCCAHHPFAGLAAAVTYGGELATGEYIYLDCLVPFSPSSHAHHLNRIHLLPLEPPSRLDNI
ncbi:uncharacterized protein BKA78DRAFT_131121 [Phyllosticta capitalensis]|uniref:uncharacterized protein n=1 Tax=Phyllosticta capitalensis TaxID=121624 RepID=UPI00312E6650